MANVDTTSRCYQKYLGFGSNVSDSNVWKIGLNGMASTIQTNANLANNGNYVRITPKLDNGTIWSPTGSTIYTSSTICP